VQVKKCFTPLTHLKQHRYERPAAAPIDDLCWKPQSEIGLPIITLLKRSVRFNAYAALDENVHCIKAGKLAQIRLQEARLPPTFVK
jgi:hypothetical protein